MTHSGQPRMNIRRCVLGAFLRDLSQAQQFFERVESFGLVSLIAREDFGQNFGGALMGKPHVVEHHVQRRDARGRKTPWLWNAGLRLPRGPHVSSRGPWSQFDPPDVHSARAACRPFSTNSSVETGKSAGSAQPNRSQDSRGPPTS
jgi:hypothetical protein